MDIKKIHRNHFKWILSEGKEGTRANFSNGEFNGLDIHGLDFRGADFHDSSILDSNFNQADLRGADFSGSDLRDSFFNRADLRGANFKDCDLRGVDFQGADLSGANLYHAELSRSNLCYANLDGADLRMVYFIHESCFPLPSFQEGMNIKVEKSFATQMAYYLCSFICDDSEFQEIRKHLLPFANRYTEYSMLKKLK